MRYAAAHALWASGAFKPALTAFEALIEAKPTHPLAQEARLDAARLAVDRLNAPERARPHLLALSQRPIESNQAHLQRRARVELARLDIQAKLGGPATRADGELYPPEDALGLIHRWDGASGLGVIAELERATEDPRWGWVVWRIIGCRHTFEGRLWAAHQAFKRGDVDESVRWVRLKLLQRAIKPVALGVFVLLLILGVVFYRRRRRP
ncbi:hypothetical protein KKF91_10035 [Myxococcota bacterium]|nr:hypothetical protein [Myxococcota bacterium]MBU1430878.1 hypothetical protein [Myxococcota bacterium]MBU1899236.1 hypothetical protein [Myxococcota bacterium]